MDNMFPALHRLFLKSPSLSQVDRAFVFNGGDLTVDFGGEADDTVISSGGGEVVLAGGFDVNGVIDSGGTITVETGGTAENPRIEGRSLCNPARA